MNLRKIQTTVMTLVCVAAMAGGPLALIGSSPVQASKSRTCSLQAQNYADRNTRRTTAGGALVGAAVGGVARGNRRNMGRGALIGGGAGLVHGSSQWQAYYNRGYRACMGR